MTEQAVPNRATRGAVDLTGLGERGAPAAPSAGAGQRASGPDEVHVQATDATFQESMTRSVRVPGVLVLVSTRLPESIVFLGTVVETARSFGGRLQVTSVDIDANPGLARALQVQSVPATIGMIQGQLVPMFAGIAPADQIRAVFEEFLGLAVQQGVTGRVAVAVSDEPVELSEHHEAAFDAIESGDLDGAAAAYEKAIAEDPNDQEAKLGLAQVGLMKRTAGVDLAAARAAAAADPDDVEAAITVADLDVLGGHVEDAFARLIDVVKRTSGAERDRARTHLISLFDVVGNHDERVKKGRTALMSALF